MTHNIEYGELRTTVYKGVSEKRLWINDSRISDAPFFIPSTHPTLSALRYRVGLSTTAASPKPLPMIPTPYR
ncbi:MAG: hypothetical protein K2H84_03165 [Paramuribaculum sp.]|nr:hypothetical protein [Paramuribaculum sp.]